MAALPRDAGFAPILLHCGASQASDKCSHTQCMLGTTTFSIGLRLVLMHTLICKDQDLQSRVQAGNLI